MLVYAVIFAHKTDHFSLVYCKIDFMKALRSIIITSLLTFAFSVQGQFYYKDQVVTRQSMQQLQQFKASKVKAVKLTSFEANGAVTDDFAGEQAVNNNYTVVSTFTKSRLSDSSQLTTFYNAVGQLVRTVDSTDGYKSSTEYTYDANNRLTKIINQSASTGQETEEEQHIWTYSGKGFPEKMLKIKNKKDTTSVSFVSDEKGNVIEENGVRKGIALPTYYYYYDDQNRLTDIVRYNPRAKRLLPDYVFEYDEDGRIATVMIVPEAGSEYEKWFYSYFENGLKGQEACYNKRQELQGRIEYQYIF